MASTIDGKIGPVTDHFEAIGSRQDLQHLTKLRDEASGILFGASTFRAWPKEHTGTDAHRHIPHFIMSNHLRFNFQAEFFKQPGIPTTIISGSDKNVLPQGLSGHVRLVSIPRGPDQIKHMLEHITACGVDALLVEGGGQILHQFIEASVLDELYLTLVPSVIGDINAPALLGGSALSNPPQIEVLETHRVGDETYLHLGFNYS